MTDYSAKIRDHLTKQRRQASTSGGTCMYRFGTLMCAVGCLIPYDKYEVEFEGLIVAPIQTFTDVDRRAVRARMQAALPGDLDFDIARHWQHYHDGSCTLYDRDNKPRGTYCYVAWCDNDMPANSPATFYDALKVHMADLAEVRHGDA